MSAVEHIVGTIPEALSDPAAVAEALTQAFAQVREAIVQDRPVLIRVPAEDLLGHFGTARAAYANALVGMCRAVAFEGGAKGWRINVVAVPAGLEQSSDELERVVSHDSMTGQVVTLGTTLIGRLAP